MQLIQQKKTAVVLHYLYKLITDSDFWTNCMFFASFNAAGWLWDWMNNDIDKTQFELNKEELLLDKQVILQHCTMGWGEIGSSWGFVTGEVVHSHFHSGKVAQYG